MVSLQTAAVPCASALGSLLLVTLQMTIEMRSLSPILNSPSCGWCHSCTWAKNTRATWPLGSHTFSPPGNPI